MILTIKKYIKEKCLKFVVTKVMREVVANITAYSNIVFSKTQPYVWCKTFKDYREILENIPWTRGARISSTDKSNAKKIVSNNRLANVSEIVEEIAPLI